MAEYVYSTQIFVYFGLADGVGHGVNAFCYCRFSLFFFLHFPPVLSSSSFQDVWLKLFYNWSIKVL